MAGVYSLDRSNISLSPLAIGTLQVSDHWANVDEAEVVKAMRLALDEGATTFDTAESYGDGYAERLLGKVIGKDRKRVVYATKVSPSHLRYSQVIAACESSLSNLGSDYIDLYQIHWPSGSMGSEAVPLDETMAAMNELKKQGKIRAIGVSNFSIEQLTEAARYARIESLQVPYSLFWRQIEKQILPYCLAHNITILAYSSLAQGLLTGKFAPEQKFDRKDVRSRNKLFRGENYRRAQQALGELRTLAEEQYLTIAQLSLAWLMSRPRTCAIAGASQPCQVTENVMAARIQLSKDVLDRIERAGRIVTDHLDNDPLLWDWTTPLGRLRGLVSASIKKIGWR